ncbi:2-isopropylmalate synthase [Pseudothermotoga thermarum]|uniref:2-isopropylmalate synthase n=1 Tax=Pseudothermotoga thermarum DSM 5069 TaxID=688269 RepID=F7YWZ9_9THEM|nr:2-isopropylmalate synthase [Pseudothermotoga thermarum]AEH50591.1 2-isopropylmalate synthase [Pseudothermotoga thermarum DSM 5069]
MEKVYIFDTTLRDGEQTPGVSLNVEEKLEIAKQLAKLNVDVIEAGFPISSPGEFQAVKTIAENVKGPVIAALARAVFKDIDAAWEALKNAESPRIHTFIATSNIHMEKKLKKSKEEVIEQAVQAVKYAKRYCSDVEFSAEDATRSDFEFLCKVFSAVIEAGATVINVPDTVGYALPWEFGELIRKLKENVKGMDKVILSVHCHNDLGLAVANSLFAVMNGADQVECTINGLGERAGNAALEEIVMALKVRKIGKDTNVNTKEIYKTSKLVSSLTGVPVQPNKAIVGANAFAHESGIHQHGVIEDPSTYEIMSPEWIGLTGSRIVLGKHSGRHAFEKRLRELGYELSKEELEKAFAKFKELADKKKEITDKDLEAILTNAFTQREEYLKLKHMQVFSGAGLIPVATVIVQIKGEEVMSTSTGNGPVDAVYKAIARAVKVPHTLLDFSLHSVGSGTDALGESIVKIADNQGNVVIGRAISTDVVEASALAYIRGLNNLLSHQQGG